MGGRHEQRAWRGWEERGGPGMDPDAPRAREGSEAGGATTGCARGGWRKRESRPRQARPHTASLRCGGRGDGDVIARAAAGLAPARARARAVFLLVVSRAPSSLPHAGRQAEEDWEARLVGRGGQ